ncbi:hypothetical protein GUJ93_ZPchr0010g10606 [Zizania palustris]|uniref:Uncharacterized protein n=1 Tax=Zizania palustris TaxID=103762 RepID=A0A8J5W913_ZIZPA|nr:hypothetical protein GUJ93_ZPchr0010g9822 [Zizania palustris]KAG8084999.1 hypothetical protein GUJ93_ZPchr0010g10606 [Zizania palustris]
MGITQYRKRSQNRFGRAWAFCFSKDFSFSAFRRWGDPEERPLASHAWGLVQRAEGLYRACSFFNLLLFLYGGRLDCVNLHS